MTPPWSRRWVRYRTWLVVFVILNLGGCSSLQLQNPFRKSTTAPVEDPAQAWQQRKQALAGFNHWEIRGRIAVQRGQKADTANMIWRRNGDEHFLEMYGPFGGGRVRITENTEQAKLVDAKGNEATGANTEELFYEQTGWRVPFAAIAFWVTGSPMPEHAYSGEVDPFGRLAELKQLDWEIDFVEHKDLEPLDLPVKVFAARPDNLDSNENVTDETTRVLKVKMIVREWILTPGSASTPLNSSINLELLAKNSSFHLPVN